MSEFLVIVVVLTQQMTFIIKPFDLDYCPSYQEAQQNVRLLYGEHDVKYWSYKCFSRGSNV
jgi:hypothetical protein